MVFLGIDKNLSGASGIAIGLENSDGEEIKLNHVITSYKLSPGRNELVFQAYVMGEPEAIKDRSIETGDFSAESVLELTYN